MSESRDKNPLPFTVPKLCIKRVPVERELRQQKLKPAVETPLPNTSSHVDRPSVSGTGSLKLVLRVPKDTDPASVASGGENSEENAGVSRENDSEISQDSSSTQQEPLSTDAATMDIESSVVARSEVDSPSSPATSVGGTPVDEAGGTTKRRRKRKRFRLTTPSQKTKTKQLKQEIAEQSARESPSPSPQRLKRSDKKKDNRNEDTSVEEPPAVPDASCTAADVAVSEEIRFPSPPPETVSSFSPLQVLLDHLLRGFLKKDPERYFAYPVTEDIAPNYSVIVSNPMDFQTIRKKIDANEYNNLQEFKADVNLISANAMSYNQKHTVYYIAAKKLETVAEYMFSKEKLTAVRKAIPLLARLTTADLGCTWAELDGQTETKAKLGYYSCIVDDMCPEEIIEQTRTAAAAAREKLNERHPNIEVLFGNALHEPSRTTTLKMLLPEHTWDKEQESSGGEGESKSRPVVLGDVVPKLKEGNPGLLLPDIHKDAVFPVTYLDNGAFSSFAPHYDSTWATLNKEESDVLLSTCGCDEECVRYIDSIRSFLGDKSLGLTGILDSFMDEITASSPPPAELDHGRDVVTTAMCGPSQESQAMTVNIQDVDQNPVVQQLLDRNGVLLQELHTVQTQRLSSQPQFVLTHAPGPSSAEVDAAASVVSNLQRLAAQATPAQLISSESIRETIWTDNGNNQTSHDYDMDVLREFLMVDDE